MGLVQFQAQVSRVWNHLKAASHSGVVTGLGWHELGHFPPHVAAWASSRVFLGQSDFHKELSKSSKGQEVEAAILF